MMNEEFQHRREALAQRMGPNSLAILSTAPPTIRNRDVHYPYRPDSDFYYLTGFPEPEAVAVLITEQIASEYILFCRPRDIAKEQWTGPIVGQKGAMRNYAANASFPIGELDKHLPEFLQRVRRVYYAMGCNTDLDQRMMDALNHIRSKCRTGVQYPLEFIALDHHLHELRLFKSANEIQSLRTAAAISAQAHRRIMRACQPGMKEYALEAEFTHECTMRGARHQAYAPIVGGGVNACVLHYENNNDILKNGDLVLIDAGCEYNYYASDITRTLPVNGRFSPAQLELYELVLEAQQAALKKIKPGNHWADPHRAAVRTLTRGLRELKILNSANASLSKMIRDEQYKPFYMHRTGHWLGMDVHDVGAYKVNDDWRLLESGMCMTIEPGLYIAPHAPGVHKRWRGIGIRIEDDVVVNAEGHEILSADVPKTASAIEALMAAVT
jgi:Xaa-Pro aminopeptidase